MILCSTTGDDRRRALDERELVQAFSAAAQHLAPLTGSSLKALTGLLQVWHFERTDWLLRAGELARWGYFVADGLVRELYVDADGEEHTRAFVTTGGFTGSLLDLLSGEPAVTDLQALEPTTVLAFSYADFDALCEARVDLTRLARRVAEALYLRKARREYELLALSAAERYARWRHEQPALDDRVSKRILASYLGITPEHLSRLRRVKRSTT